MYEVPPTNKQKETRYWSNTNKLFNKNEEFYYEDCIGGKSGFTNEAGMTLVSYAHINGRYIMIVTLGAASATQVYTDHTVIYDYIKENVSEEYFEDVERNYIENRENDIKEEVSGNSTDSEENIPASANADEAKGTNIWLTVIKIIGIAILVFIVAVIILYGVLIIRLKIHRMKRRRRMLQRKRRHSSEIFFDMKGKD